MVKTEPFEAARYLISRDAQADLLNDAFANREAAYITRALGVIARARGMTEIAREANVTCEALCKSLSEAGGPGLTALLSVTRALGMTLSVQAKQPEP